MATVLLDTLANALCLCMTLRIMGKRARRFRVAAGAGAGALFAFLLRLAGVSGALRALCWMPLALLMTAAATGGIRLRTALVLFACEGLLGGTVFALAGALGSIWAAWGVGIVFVGAMSVNALQARRAASDVRRVRIRITAMERTAEFQALVDSGNCLRDYLTHRPVIVLPVTAKGPLGLRDAPLRPIFADTAGGRQMMDCLTPQAAEILLEGHAVRVNACAAFSPGLSQDAPALVPETLLAPQEHGMD